MRVYVPATTTVLRQLIDDGQLPAGGTAFAVTPALREWYTEGDQEELEYAAFTAAAQASLRLIDEDPKAHRRRAVLAADLPDESVRPRPDLDRGVVRLSVPVSPADVASAHLDDADAEPAVAAAAAAVLEADLGSEDAQFTVDEAEGYELAWYATQEIGPLLELL